MADDPANANYTQSHADGARRREDDDKELLRAAIQRLNENTASFEVREGVRDLESLCLLNTGAWGVRTDVSQPLANAAPPAAAPSGPCGQRQARTLRLAGAKPHMHLHAARSAHLRPCCTDPPSPLPA